MTAFTIGQFSFINLSRALGGPQTRTEREVRPGVDGVTFWNTGWRAEPFQVLSVADTADVDDARDALWAYEALAGKGPVEMWWAGRFDSMVFVHRVEALEGGIHQTLLGVGGRLGTSHGMIRALWTLEYWPNTGNEQ